MRRKKKNNNLKNLGLGALVATLGIYGYLTFVNSDFTFPPLEQFYKFKNESRIQESIQDEEIIEKTEEVKPIESKVKIFFIAHSNGKDVYHTVYRVNDSGVSDIEYAVRCLIQGPTKYEQGKGVYSEIPPTRVLSVKETPNKVIINLSDAFGNGGGADSIYKRMYQLIKTVNYNTDKPVYLMINGQIVEALGGEGLMLKQPLNRSSLDD